ncbi:MAG: hypothetical protein QHH30_01690 [candidate division NC10 bacterium]|nr:hypothetical protein [candidate division NC10 bacterium]
MNILNLFKGAVISIESRDGRKKVWLHIGNQRFPLVNRADLEEGMALEAPSWQMNPCAPLEERTKGGGLNN